MIHPKTYEQAKELLAQMAQWTYRKGGATGTSTNYSLRLSDHEEMLISSSGVDKEFFHPTDTLIQDLDGKVMYPAHARPSAESMIHRCIYRAFKDIKACFHTHSLPAVHISQIYSKQNYCIFEGMEILKGIEGISTHETIVKLPIFPNEQNMDIWEKRLDQYFNDNYYLENNPYALLIEGHGLYIWAQNFFQAKRHLEVWEYLLQWKWDRLASGIEDFDKGDLK